MRYNYNNPNPLSKRTSDCVIRVFSLALGVPWEEIYTKLCQIGLERKVIPTSREAYEYYLAHYTAAQKIRLPRKPGYTYETPASFARSHPEGIYLLKLPDYMTVCIQGEIQDIKDCTEKKIYGGWKIK